MSAKSKDSAAISKLLNQHGCGPNQFFGTDDAVSDRRSMVVYGQCFLSNRAGRRSEAASHILNWTPTCVRFAMNASVIPTKCVKAIEAVAHQGKAVEG